MARPRVSATLPSASSSGADSGYPASRRRSISPTRGIGAPMRAASDERRRRGPALGARRGRAVDGHCALERRALRGDGPRVVARVGLLLVRRVVLLVDDDQSHPAHGREDRRACADHDPRLPARDAVALVAPLGISQRRVDDRDAVAESLPEATDRLRREGDLRHEDDRAEAPLETCGARLEIDLGLAASGRPLEQHVVADALVEGRDDLGDRRTLVVSELLGLGLAGERLAPGGRGPLAAGRPAKRARRARAPVRASSRSSRRPRARGRRASPGSRRGHGRPGPARHLPERRPRRRPRRRGSRCVPGAPQRSPLCRPVGHFVGERAGERAGRDERIDGRERHPASVLAPCGRGTRVNSWWDIGGKVRLTWRARRSGSRTSTKRFGDVVAVDAAEPRDPKRRGRRAARAVRLRQDDAPPHDRGVRAAGLRRDRARRGTGRRRRRLGAAGEAARRHGVPGLRALPASDRGRERRLRPASRRARRPCSHASRNGRSRGSRRAVSRTSSPVGSSSAWPWRVPWRPPRPSYSSTSRGRTSTRSFVPSCGKRSRRCSDRSASRRCSSRTTARRRSLWPTASH